jgi:hypothetical protein
MNIIKRAKAPTPKFFRIMRTIGLTVAAVGGSFLAAPVALPAGLVTVAGYLTIAGSVMSAVSQTAVENDKIKNADESSSE